MKNNKLKEVLPAMSQEAIKPKEDKKIEFTDIYGNTYKGTYIIDEDMFFIGFGLTGDFRYSYQVNNWKYTQC
jgi:hypothetical protein